MIWSQRGGAWEADDSDSLFAADVRCIRILSVRMRAAENMATTPLTIAKNRCPGPPHCHDTRKSAVKTDIKAKPIHAWRNAFRGSSGAGVTCRFTKCSQSR